ncbi:MAG: hypothetical protein MRY83_12105 [Flavobacteriales bacterium]|nr:hypothetical protein [Flavobacteriales bacterium]
MKHIFLALSLVCGTLYTNAQGTFKVKDNGATFVCDRMESVKTSLLHEDGKRKCTKKEWAKYLRKNHEIKLEGIGLFQNKDVLTATDVDVDQLSENSVNLVTVFESVSKNQTIMHVFLNGGYGPYKTSFSEDDKEMKNLRGLVTDFVGEYKAEYYDDEIKAKEKEIESLVDERWEMIQKNRDLRSEILDNQRTINDLERENADLRMEMEMYKGRRDHLDEEISDSVEEVENLKK